MNLNCYWTCPHGKDKHQYGFKFTVPSALATHIAISHVNGWFYHCPCGKTLSGAKQAIREHIEEECPLQEEPRKKLDLINSLGL